MPRVTSLEQFRRHRFVRMLFTESGMDVLFALISVPDQYELHLYYATDHDFTPDEFEEYREELDASSPSLANKAGKHFKVIEGAFITVSRGQGVSLAESRQAVANAIAARNLTPVRKQKEKAGATSASSRGVHVVPIARPVDPREVARAMLMTANWIQEQEREKAETKAEAASSSSSDPSQTGPRVGSVTTPPPEAAEPPEVQAA